MYQTNEDLTITQDSSLFTNINSDEADLTMGGRRSRNSRRSNSRLSSFFSEGGLSSLFSKRGRSQRTINTDCYNEYNSIDALNNSNVGNNNIFNFFSFFS